MNNADGIRHSAAICLYPIRARSKLTIFPQTLTHRIRFGGNRAQGVEFETRNGSCDTAFAGQVILAAGAIGTPLLLQRSGVGKASDLESIGIAAVVIPSTGVAGPNWGFEDLVWAVEQAKDGKFAILTFHGVPALEHPWVDTTPELFRTCMDFLRDRSCTVIALRDLAGYVGTPDTTAKEISGFP